MDTAPPTVSRAPGPLTRRAVWAIAAVGLVVLGYTVWFTAVTQGAPDPFADLVGAVLLWMAIAAFVVSGAIILSRQPRNVIGWLLILPGMVLPAIEVIAVWLRSMDPPPEVATLSVWLAIWLTSWSWVLLIFPVFHLLLTFPSGRLLSSRWKWVVWLEVAMIATIVGAVTFGSRMGVTNETGDTLWSVSNPIGFLGSEYWGDGFNLVWNLCLVTVTVAGVTAFVVRFRRGDAVERQQLKWPLFAVALFGTVFAWGALSEGLEGGLADAFFGLALGGIPAAVAIAVLRFRLYEIDRIISRTVTYTFVVGLLALLFTAGVVWIPTALSIGDSPLVVAGSTLLVAGLFNPLRRLVQRGVDSRFNRSRYNTVKVVDEFAASLRDQIDPDELIDGYLGVVKKTMQPWAIGIWLR